MVRRHVLAVLVACWPGPVLRAAPVEWSFGPAEAGTWQELGELAPSPDPAAPRVLVRASFRLRPSPAVTVELRSSLDGPPVRWPPWSSDGTYRVRSQGQEYVVRLRGLAPRPWVQVASSAFVAKVPLPAAAPGAWALRDLPSGGGWRARCRAVDRALSRFEVQLVAPDGRRGRVLSVAEDADAEQPWGAETLVVSCSATTGAWGTVQVFGPADPKPLAVELDGLRERPLDDPDARALGAAPHRPPTVDDGEVEDEVAVTLAGVAPAGITLGPRRVTWGRGRHELLRWQFPEGGSMSESGYLFVDRTARTWSIPLWLYTGSVSSAQATLFPDGLVVLADELGFRTPRLFVLAEGGPEPAPVPYEALWALRDEAVARSLVAAGPGARHEPPLAPIRVTAARRLGRTGERLALTAGVEVSVLVGDRPERHRWRLELVAANGRALTRALTPQGVERP